MHFGLNDDQQSICTSVRRFLVRSGELKAAEACYEEGTGAAIWAGLSTELGLGGLLVGEEFGGMGLDLVTLSSVMEELGRVVAPGPLLATALGAMALGEGPKSAAAAAWLPQIAEGSVAAALAYEPDGRAGLRWWLEEGRIRLEGRAGQVIEGAAAGLLVVAARGDAGTLLVALTPDHEGVEVVNRPTMDRTRNLAMLEVNTSVTEEAVIVGAEGGAAALARVLQRGAILLAAEALGGAQRCMDISVEYAKVRVQFGRPIGSFQSIAHKCADMLVKVESARSAVLYAAWAADSGGDDLLSVSGLAKSYAAEAYYRVAGSMIQVMGGIGFTWEHEAHLHFKRARASQQLLGSTEHHREQLAAMLLDEA